MAPHVGFDTDQVRDKARKDLLYLLEGVSKMRSLARLAAWWPRLFAKIRARLGCCLDCRKQKASRH